MYNAKTGEFEGPAGIVYFDLHLDVDAIEEDQREAADGDEDAINRLTAGGLWPADDSGRAAHALEQRGLCEAAEVLRPIVGEAHYLTNEGHDPFGDLVCRFGVSARGEVAALDAWIASRRGGGDDIVYLATPYCEVRGFRLYDTDAGVNGAAWGVAPDTLGTLAEWLEAHPGNLEVTP